MAVLAVLLALGVPGVAGAGVTEFPAPGLGADYSADITAGPDGNVWFTEPSAHKVTRITPSGSVTEFALPTANASPSEIVAGSDGALWFIESGAKLGRITTGGSVTEIPISGTAGDIVDGPDGALWYTLGSKVGRMTTGGSVTEFDVSAGAQIVAGSDGALWLNLGTRLGRLTTSGSFTSFPIALPSGKTVGSAWNLAAGPDGALWYQIAEQVGDGVPSQIGIGRMTTAGSATAFPASRALPFPEGITGGSDGAVWFTEIPDFYSPTLSKIARITPGGTITEYVATGGAITSGPDGALWFTEPGKIGRITTDTPPGPILEPLYPAGDKTQVATDTYVIAFLNKAMDKPATQAAFSLKRTSDGAPVAGTFGWYGNAMIFKSNAPLAAGTQYTASVSGAARDASGNAIQNPKTWKFITAGGPALNVVSPRDGETGVYPDASVLAVFDRPMDRASTHAALTVKRTSDGAPVAGTYTWFFNDTLVGFRPGSLLFQPGTQYTATLTSAAKDKTGKPLANPLTWRFTTAVGPIAHYVSPPSGSSGVASNAPIIAGFNKPMNHASVQAAFTLRRNSDSAPVAGTFGWYGNAMIFKPNAPLQPGTSYDARVEDTATDTSGNRMARPEGWWFTSATSSAATSTAVRLTPTRSTALPADIRAAVRSSQKSR